MLSVSKLLSAKSAPGAGALEALRYSAAGPPVVVWNLTRRCNLHCAHCYNSSEEKAYPGELTTEEACRVIDGLAAFKVPAVIFSGGDPLLRRDIFDLMSRARAAGIRPVLSTSGVNIDEKAAKLIKDSGALYAGVSIDGGEEVNDRLRGERGAYAKALRGLRLLRDEGVVAGIRFTMSRKTIGELASIFDLLEKEGVYRGYFAHLVYSGRGEKFSREDLSKEETRQAVDYIFDRAIDFIARGLERDIVTGSNDADGVYLYLRLKKTDPEKAERVRALLVARGGNSSGVSLANIDNLGEVHPDQFWAGVRLGNVKERDFAQIWTDPQNPLLRALRCRKGLVKGRCSVCPHFDICGGSYRVRAEYGTGDAWAEDPACYLTDEELGRAAYGG